MTSPSSEPTDQSRLRAKPGQPWVQVTVATALGAVGAVVVAGLMDGVRWGPWWIASLAVLLVGVMERFPVAVSPGGRGRRYHDLTEVGFGVVLAYASPAVMGLVVGLGHVPLLMRQELSVWKRTFGIAHAALAAVVAGSVFALTVGTGPRIWALVAAGVAYILALVIPMVVMARALADKAIELESIRSIPTGTVASVAGIACGTLIGEALNSRDWMLVGLAAAVGAGIVVRAAHEAAMQADRMRVMFEATAELYGSPQDAGLDGLLRRLAPLVVPGAEHLAITSEAPDHGEAIAVGQRGWLTVLRGAAADRPTSEDRKRLQLLAGVIDGAVRRAEEVSEASEAAATDPLTGVLNRRGLDAAIRQVNSTSTVVMLDLDGLKAINDTHGHPAGDAAIKALATALRRGVRACDLVARVGGDEFIVVLLGQDPLSSRPVIERLVASANDDPGLPEGVCVQATTGAASWKGGAHEPWSAAAARADADLYALRSARRSTGR